MACNDLWCNGSSVSHSHDLSCGVWKMGFAWMSTCHPIHPPPWQRIGRGSSGEARGVVTCGCVVEDFLHRTRSDARATAAMTTLYAHGQRRAGGNGWRTTGGSRTSSGERTASTEKKDEASFLLRERNRHRYISFASLVLPVCRLRAFPPPPPPFLERCEVVSRLLSRVVQAPFLRGCRNFAHFIVLVFRTASRATRTSPRSIHERCASARRREGRAPRHPPPSEEKKLSSSTARVVTSQPNVVVGRLARVLDSSPPVFFCFDLFCCTSHSSCLHVALDRREASFRIEGWPRGPCVAMPCVPVRWSVRAGV